MDKYLEAEKQLAKLLGWTDPDEVGDPLNHLIAGHAETYWEGTYLPRWTRDNAAAFALMVEHECWPEVFHYTKTVRVVHDGTTLYQGYLPNHHDKETAVRYAIVQAVIAKLEQEKKHEV